MTNDKMTEMTYDDESRDHAGCAGASRRRPYGLRQGDPLRGRRHAVSAGAARSRPASKLFALHAADGTPIMLTDTREAAIANAWSQELEAVSVH